VSFEIGEEDGHSAIMVQLMQFHSVRPALYGSRCMAGALVWNGHPIATSGPYRELSTQLLLLLMALQPPRIKSNLNDAQDSS
jgi:hypothetical protein